MKRLTIIQEKVKKRMPATQKKRMAFEVKGEVTESGESRPFIRIVNAFSESNARERTLSHFGSKNKIKRRNITIREIKQSKGA